MKARLITGTLALMAVVALSTFLAAAQHEGEPPAGDYVPRRVPEWQLTGPDAPARRLAALASAAVRIPPSTFEATAGLEPLWSPGSEAVVACRYLNDPPSGTTAKFNCVLDGGAVIKVKYGRNPEIQGEVAGTGLLRRLGYPSDDVDIVPNVRCYGCPRDPFVIAVASTWTYTRPLFGASGFDDGYTDFEWVAVERRFPAPPITTDDREGWAWWELHDTPATRTERDALRLLAVFLAHWDNKSENQRLVCLDGAPPATDVPDCTRPLAMIQDLGATFGPTKVNIARWAVAPIWQDRSTCLVSMRTLPWGGGTFPDAQISEAGRRQLAEALAAIGDEELRDLFRAARFPEYQAATPDERDLRQWVDVFRSRVRQIVDAGPCPGQ